MLVSPGRGGTKAETAVAGVAKRLGPRAASLLRALEGRGPLTAEPPGSNGSSESRGRWRW